MTIRSIADRIRSNGTPVPVETDEPENTGKQAVPEHPANLPNQEVLDARAAAIGIAKLLTDPNARCWTDGATFHAEKLFDIGGKRVIRQWAFTFASVSRTDQTMLRM